MYRYKNHHDMLNLNAEFDVLNLTSAQEHSTVTLDSMKPALPLLMDGDDFAGDDTTTGTIAPLGGTISGVIEVADDYDWFAVELTAGVAFSVTLTTTSDVFNIGLELNDPTGLASYFGVADGNTRVMTFMPSLTTTHYVQVWGLNAGDDYTLTTTAVPDGFDDNRATTESLTVEGDDYAGTLDSGFDNDYIAFDVTAGQSIEFTLTNLLAADRVYDFSILTPEGQSVASANTANATSNNLIYTFSEAGTYYIVVGEVFSRTGSYSIGTAVVTDDYSSDTGTTGTLALDGASTSGAFDYDGDVDWFGFTLGADQAIRLDFTLTSQITLYDADGNFVMHGANLGNGATNFIETFLSAGTYFAAATQQEGVSSDYTFTLSTLTDDHGTLADTSSILTVDGQVSGRLNYSNDSDVFIVEITGAGLVGFNLEDPDGSSIPNGGVINSTYTLYDDEGNIVVTNNVFQVFGEELIYDFDQAGTYYLEITNPFSNGPFDESSDYVLTASTIIDDHGNNNNTTSFIIADGRGYSGNIGHVGDADWFGITIDDPGTILDFIAIPESIILLADIQFTVYDIFGTALGAGQFIEGDIDNSIADDYVTFSFEFEDAGEYFVAINGSDMTTALTGSSYLIGAIEAADIHGEQPEEAGTLLLNGARSFGRIDSGTDNDWFGFTAEAGQVINIDVRDLTEQVPDSFMMLTLYDAAGNIIQILNPEIDSYYVWTADSDGQYYVGLGYDEAFASGGRSFEYSIHATLGLDDYADNMTTTGSLTLDGGPIDGRIETSNDVDWLSFTATAGEITRLRISDTDMTSFTFQIFDSSGALITSSDSQPEYISYFDFTPDSTGDYFIAFSAGDTGVQGGYSLSHNSSVIAPGYIPVFDVDARPAIALPDIGATPTIAPTTTIRQNVDNPLTIAADDVIFTDFVDDPLYDLSQGGSITNNGTIWVQETGSAAVVIGSGGTVTNNGTIVSMSQESTAYSLLVNLANLINTGDIFVGSNTGGAVGVSTGADVSNSGNIRVHSESGDAWGIQQGASAGDLVNEGNFIITAELRATGVSYVGRGTVDNSGLFEVTSQTQTSIGFDFFNSSSVINSGTITAGVAMAVSNGTLTLTNSGTINGVVFANGGNFADASTITNTGTIRGNVILAEGDDVYDGTGGFLDGILFLEGGDDTATGGSGSDFFVGGMGDDTLNGGGGTDYAIVEGGTLTSYTLTDNGDGSFALSGLQGTDTLIGIELIGIVSSPDVFGNTTINYYTLADFTFTDVGGSAANEYMMGTGQNETITGGEGHDRFILGDDSGQDHITDFTQGVDGINLMPGSFLTLAEIQAAMTQYDGFVVLDLGNGNGVRIDGMLITDFLATDFLIGGQNPDGDGDYKSPGKPLPPKGGTGQKPIDPPSADDALEWADSDLSIDPIIDVLMDMAAFTALPISQDDDIKDHGADADMGWSIVEF